MRPKLWLVVVWRLQKGWLLGRIIAIAAARECTWD
jgi:hypothetical protein